MVIDKGGGAIPLNDEIDDGLRTLAATVDRARSQTAAIDDALTRISTTAAAAGFTGIVARLTAVREVVADVHRRLAAAGDVLGHAFRSVAAVPGQPSPHDITNALNPALAALTAVDGGLGEAASRVEQATRLVTATLQGGEPGPTLSRLQQLSRTLTAAKAHGHAARQRVKSALTRARQVGATGHPAAIGGNTSRGPSRDPLPAGPGQAKDPAGTSTSSPVQDPAIPEPADPAWAQADPATLPDTVRNAAGRLTPRPAGSTRPTQGYLDGTPVTSGGGDRTLAADLDHDPLRGPPVTFYDHAESKAAAHMRRTGRTESDLAIDNTVCGTNDRDKTYPYTCDKILPAILPTGSRLRVWVTRDGGNTWWHRIYTGTGERITR
ncbi:DUF6244 family protein [Polymorphospora rubra]|uniref:DUF6244 family protein n=1 Tax=Polymorphospora rubra TaxID=338584 RepID=UPI0033D95380